MIYMFHQSAPGTGPKCSLIIHSIGNKFGSQPPIVLKKRDWLHSTGKYYTISTLLRCFLFKIGKEDTDMCSLCNVTDDPDHFFFECVKTKLIWHHANQVILSTLNKRITLSVEHVLFHYHKDIKEEINKFINLVICVGKMCISRFRYGDHPCLISLFKRELRLRKILPD